MADSAHERLHSCPFKGLVPYGEADAEFFFGRETERETIIDNLLAWPLTLLYGPSGVGKSSVLSAGVACRLHERSRENLEENGTPRCVLVVFSSWRDDPVPALARRIEDSVGLLFRQAHQQPPATPNETGLAELLEAWSHALKANLLVILDQFEELFLYHQDGGAFANEFVRAVNWPRSGTSFLISIREDSLARLDTFKGRIPDIFRNYLRIGHLERRNAIAAICRPIQVYNRHEENLRIGIERSLVKAVLDFRPDSLNGDKTGRGSLPPGNSDDGSRFIEAPYLQLVMTRLWEEEARDWKKPRVEEASQAGSCVLRLSTLVRLGGAAEIVRTFLDSAMEALTLPEQETAADAFLHLITPSGAKIAYYLRDLAAYANRPEHQVKSVLDKLCGKLRFPILRMVADQAGIPRYEVSHDRLASPILNWRSRFVRAQEERRQEALLVQARAEATRQRRRVMQMAFVVILAVLAAGLAGLEWWRARTNAHSAEVNEQTAKINAHKALENEQVAKTNAHRAEQSEQIAKTNAALAAESEQAAKANAARAADSERIAKANALRAADSEQAAKTNAALAAESEQVAKTNAARAADSERISKANALRAQENEQSAKTNASMAEANAQIAMSHELAATAVNNLETDPELSVLLAMHAMKRQESKETLDALNRALLGLRLEANLSYPADDHPVHVVFSPNGQLVAIQTLSHRVYVWDGSSRRELLGTGPAPGSYDLHFSDDGSRLGAAAGDQLLVWDVASGRQLLTFGKGEWIQFGFTARGIMAATVGRDVRVWDPATGRLIRDCRGPDRQLGGIAFDPSGQYFAEADSDHKIRLWKINSSAPPAILSGHTDKVLDVAFSRDGKLLASGSMDETVRLWSLDGQLLRTLGGHTNTVLAVAFDGIGRLASAGADARVKVWDVQSGRELFSLVGHQDPIDGIAFSSDGQRLATASRDLTVKIWNSSSHSDLIRSVGFSRDGHLLATGSRDGTVRLWDVSTLHDRGTLPRALSQEDQFRAIDLSPIRDDLAAVSAGGQVVVWDLPSRRIVFQQNERRDLNSVAFRPTDGDLLALGGADGTAILWDLRTRHRFELSPKTSQIGPVRFSLDGNRLVAGDEDGNLMAWDTRGSHQQITPAFHAHGDFVMAAAFSPDGRYFTTGGLDRVVRFWDSASLKEELKPLGGHSNTISAIAFSRDGKYLATGSWDRTARIWEVSSGQEKFSFTHRGEVADVAFSPDGTRLATGGDTVPHIYLLDPKELMREAKTRMLRLGRVLTSEECETYLHVKACPEMP